MKKTIWSMLKRWCWVKSDIQFFNRQINLQIVKQLLLEKVKGYDLKKINDYIAQYNTS